MFRRARHQEGSLQRVKRKSGQKVWIFRWYEIQPDGSKRYRKVVVGTAEEFKTESDAQKAVDALRLTINEQTPRQQLTATSASPPRRRRSKCASAIGRSCTPHKSPHKYLPRKLPRFSEPAGEPLLMRGKNGSSGRTQTYNPPVNRLVRSSNFKDIAAQMTTHGSAKRLEVITLVTLK